MPTVQQLIHNLEVGKGLRLVKLALALFALVALVVTYNLRSYRNLATLEAMDAAQVGRNLAEGRGYSTKFIRPLSLHFVQKTAAQRLPTAQDVEDLAAGGLASARAKDSARLAGAHPDLANPPLYPVVLAGLMKVLPFHHNAFATGGFWTRNGKFWRYQPDFLIALFNESVFFVTLLLVFLLARRLFDPTSAWVTAMMMLGTEIFWRFSTSGLSTMLLLLIFVVLLWCLVLLDEEFRLERRHAGWLFGMAAAAGAVLGLGALTRYAFAWLILPLACYLVIFAPRRRWLLALTAGLTFAAVFLPWVSRNLEISGVPFGTATFAVIENTSNFTGTRLMRSLEPDFNRIAVPELWTKLLGNTRTLLQNDLPKLGGTWVSAFFLVGLLVGYRSEALRRLRYFLVSSLLLLIVVQALGRTHLSDEVPDINSENLLILFLPAILMYGISLFFMLLDRVRFPFRALRYFSIAGFALVSCLPMLFAFLPPRPIPVVYPPYFPPSVQQIGTWMRAEELLMSDIPWAMAWYGNRQCLWLPLTPQRDFFAINDYLKPIRGLYLTPRTLDGKLLTDWVRAGESTWGAFVLETVLRRKVPDGFPLRASPPGLLPEQLFLSDWERWRVGAAPISAPSQR